MRIFLSLLAIACTCSACGGRAHLSDEYGYSSHKLFQAQAESRPRQALAPMTATEAQAVMSNYGARYNASKKGGAPTSNSGFGSSGAGNVLPFNSLSHGDDFNGRSIKLQAK